MRAPAVWHRFAMSVRRPYSPSGSGRLFGLLTVVVVLVPIAVAAIVLLELDLLGDDDTPSDDAAATQAEALPEDDLPSPLESLGGGELLQPDREAELSQLPAADHPAPGLVHIVAAGDTVGSIARAFGVSVPDILAANEIPDPNALLIGQQIVIPPTAGTADAALTCRLCPRQPTVPTRLRSPKPPLPRIASRPRPRKSNRHRPPCPRQRTPPSRPRPPKTAQMARRTAHRTAPRRVQRTTRASISASPSSPRSPGPALQRTVGCHPCCPPVRCSAAPPAGRDQPADVGEWRSPAARFVRDEEVGGSNPLSPTTLCAHLIPLTA